MIMVNSQLSMFFMGSHAVKEQTERTGHRKMGGLQHSAGSSMMDYRLKSNEGKMEFVMLHPADRGEVSR
jgi:hypothetical protein